MEIDGKSLDLNLEKINALKALFPDVFSEGRIDFERLRQSLSPLALDEKKEHYELSWAGKRMARQEIQKQTTATLTESGGERGENSSPHSIPHTLITGENLEVLRVLQKSYFGKVKMIYIDPPYNTGNDSFVYPDDYAERKIDYEKRADLKDTHGYLNKQDLLRKNTKDNGQFHSVWLSMMYPRLYIARNLLREDGVIFISIDDNEASNLKLLCDEIFGEENFICEFVWNSSTGGGIRSKYVNQNHEYLLCYAKSKTNLPMFFAPLSKEAVKMYNRKDTKGVYREKDFAWKNDSNNANQKYLIECPDGSFVKPQKGYIFRFVEETFLEYLNENKVVFKRTETSPLLDEQNNQAKWNIYIKKYLDDGTGAPTSLIPNSLVGLSNLGTQTIQNLFGERFFNNAKSVEYLSYLISIGTQPSENHLILDFFAGSGTTAQAVMELNEEDGGSRQFICVQLPEPLEEGSEAKKAGYSTIADITQARITKVIERITKERAGKLDFTHKPLPTYRAYRLTESHFKIWHSDIADKESVLAQLNAFQESQKPEATPENMLTELLLKLGIGLGSPLTPKGGISPQVYEINSALWICFENYTEALKEAVLEAKPAKLLMLDACFADDNALKNFHLELKDYQINLVII